VIYTISLSCKHTENREITGAPEQIARKIKWLEKKGLCKECYIQKKNEEPIVLNVARYNDGSRDAYAEKIILYITGNAYPVRAELIKEGYTLGILPPIGRKGVVEKEIKAWRKTCTLSNLELEVALVMPYCHNKVSTLNGIDEMVMSRYRPRYQDAINQLRDIPEPKCPEWIQNIQITEKIYGKPGQYSIYARSGDKKEISDQQAQELQKYFKEKEAYQSKILKIRETMN